ncbi:MAG: hypothetical protein J6A29_04785 [Clostridia bacterium]|nr:hypothetical protein [Clostridia bacterium]
MERSHNNENKAKGHTKRNHVLRISPENSIDRNEIAVCVPRSFLSVEEIRKKEAEGRTIIFVVEKKHSYSADGCGPSIDLKPLRDSAGNYLVVVCW